MSVDLQIVPLIQWCDHDDDDDSRTITYFNIYTCTHTCS